VVPFTQGAFVFSQNIKPPPWSGGVSPKPVSPGHRPGRPGLLSVYLSRLSILPTNFSALGGTKWYNKCLSNNHREDRERGDFLRFFCALCVLCG
jgi:hypothetical protein